MLHLKFPLFLLIPAYNNLLLAFDGHSSTSLYSPGGAFTLTQPVVRAKSFPRWASRAVFHSSLSPLYLLVCISLEDSLWIYNQQDRSGSKLTFFDRVFVDCHFSVVYFVGFGGCVDLCGVCVDVCGVCSGCVTRMVYVLVVGAMVIFGRMIC
jgi:hypothetical protein